MNNLKFYGKESNYYFGGRLEDEDYDVFFCPTKEFDESGEPIIYELSSHWCYLDTCILWAAYFIEKNPDMKWYAIKIQNPDTDIEKKYYSYDELLEDVWRTLIDFPVDEDEKIEENWFIFEAGTDKEYIWHWFDERYSKGVGYLLENIF